MYRNSISLRYIIFARGVLLITQSIPTRDDQLSFCLQKLVISNVMLIIYIYIYIYIKVSEIY